MKDFTYPHVLLNQKPVLAADCRNNFLAAQRGICQKSSLYFNLTGLFLKSYVKFTIEVFKTYELLVNLMNVEGA